MAFPLSRFLLLALALFVFAPAWAQTQNDKPVEIEASQHMEWLRDQNRYRANGDVKITQGDVVITGDTAEASYDPQQGPSALTIITMDGNVVMTSGTRRATAPHAVYDVRTETLTLTGGNMSVTAPDLTVTAQDTMIYESKTRKATATGSAQVKQPQQTLRAQNITAWFDENNALQRAEATGNVTILRQTPKGQEIAQSQRGTYDLVKNQAVLTGNVKLTQGDNHMQGDIATIDLKTGYASLKNSGTGQQSGGGRVRAIFTPASKEGSPDAP